MIYLDDCDYWVTKKVLTEARALLAAGWCREAYARDKHRHALDDVWSSRACKFCASGALMRVRSGLKYPSYYYDKSESVLTAAMNTPSIPQFNDTHTKKQVLQKFDEAIASL